MIIDKNGIINTQNLGLKIGRGFDFEEFKNNSNFKDFVFRGSNNDYVRYHLNNIILDSLPFSALLIFYKNKISRISIIYRGIKYKSGPLNWEEEKEVVDLIKKKHDELLMVEHGAIAKKYSWGFIRSVLDPYHSYDARISIIYNTPENESSIRNQSMIISS